jgi:hypothetical protein
MANESDSGQPMPGTHETTILCTMFKGIIEGWNCNLQKKHRTILLPEIVISLGIYVNNLRFESDSPFLLFVCLFFFLVIMGLNVVLLLNYSYSTINLQWHSLQSALIVSILVLGFSL